jgi:hypothetical protein
LNSAFGQTAKPANAQHAAITGTCEQCHASPTSWSILINGGKPDHSTFNASTACGGCHVSGGSGTPKIDKHIPTTLNCFSCHGATGWTPTKWNHTQQTVANACSTCHASNYQGPGVKPGNHIPYAMVPVSASANCDKCHKAGTTSWSPGKFHSYNTVTAQCATCHAGSYLGPGVKPNNHIPYAQVTAAASAVCETCHKSTTDWATGTFHSSVTTGTQCASCHLTSAYGQTAKPANAQHAAVTGTCEQCHASPTSWSILINGGKPDHSVFNASTACGGCHVSGGSGTPKIDKHIPTSLNCFSCHSVTGWTPTKWNHTQQTVANACSTCHTGGYQGPDGKPANHIPYAMVPVSASANCDKCHKAGTTSWNPGKFHAYNTVTAQCATCHAGSYLGPGIKPSNHIPYVQVSAAASAVCETCHKSTTDWATGKFHTNVTTGIQCASCHLTSAYGQTAKPANTQHAAITGTCEQCHASSTSWSILINGGKPDHSVFNASTPCGGCHVSGGSGTPKVGNHIPTSLNCFSCHSVTGWTPTKWNHTQQTVANACSTCHASNYQGPGVKPGNHIPYAMVPVSASANCDKCHKAGTTSWSPGKFHAYNTVTAQCATCHAGSYLGPGIKSNGHIPYAQVTAAASAVCETCHKSTTDWGTGKFHTSVTVTSQCNVCHNTSQYGQMVKPSNHIPLAQLLNGTTMDCSACHKSTTAGGFGTATMNHNNSQGAGSGWCKGCHLSSTAFLGSMEKKSSSHLSGRTDCSTSGCHRPLGTRGTTYRSW